MPHRAARASRRLPSPSPADDAARADARLPPAAIAHPIRAAARATGSTVGIAAWVAAPGRFAIRSIVARAGSTRCAARSSCSVSQRQRRMARCRQFPRRARAARSSACCARPPAGRCRAGHAGRHTGRDTGPRLRPRLAPGRRSSPRGAPARPRTTAARAHSRAPARRLRAGRPAAAHRAHHVRQRVGRRFAHLSARSASGHQALMADRIWNALGPGAARIARMHAPSFRARFRSSPPQR